MHEVVVDDVRVSVHDDVAEQEAVVVPQEAAAREISDHGRAVLRLPLQRSILVREVDLGLNGARSMRRVLQRELIWEVDAAGGNVLVVKVRDA